MHGVMARSLLLAAVLALGTSEAARTEIYKCVGADGKTLFTSDRSQCPGAERHESRGRVEPVPTRSRPSVRRPPASRRGQAIGGAEGNKALWGGKKLQAETELRDLELRLEYVRRAAGWCNRGHTLYSEDDNGIRSGYDCRNVQNEYQEVKARLAGLRLYLDEGLEEECRRAGCLPGWIR
jgi:hypothetical protein